MARILCCLRNKAKLVGKERQKTTRLFVGVAIHTSSAVKVLKLGETQKWTAELLESLDTATSAGNDL